MTRYDIYIKTKLDNRVIVCKDKKFGVIDNKENVIIPVKYDKIEVNDTYNHFIVTQIHGYDKKYGLLDINAGVLLPVVYDTIETGYLRNIWYRLEKDNMKGLYNIIDKKEILYECDSLQIYDNGNSIIVKKGELYGIYDFNGEELIPVEYNNIFLISNGYICRKGKYYGVIDKSNNIVVDFEYSNIEERNNDVLECEQGNKCGLLTLTGEVILPCEYDKIQHLVNDLYGAFIKKTKKYCIVVAKKKIYTEAKYDLINYRNYGNISVCANGKTTILTANGEERFPCIFEDIQLICKEPELFAVCENRLYGIIKADGSYLVKPKYKDIDKFTYGFAIVKAENYKEGLIDLNGYEIIPTVYDTINIINEKYVVVRQNFKEGLLETNGKMRLPVIYESVGENIVDDMVQVQLCGYLGIAKLMD